MLVALPLGIAYSETNRANVENFSVVHPSNSFSPSLPTCLYYTRLAFLKSRKIGQTHLGYLLPQEDKMEV
jgi:hypothetical protein